MHLVKPTVKPASYQKTQDESRCSNQTQRHDNGEETEAITADSEREGDKLIEVVQQLLERQQREKEEQQARWEQREEELSREKKEEIARWEQQQEEL